MPFGKSGYQYIPPLLSAYLVQAGKTCSTGQYFVTSISGHKRFYVWAVVCYCTCAICTSHTEPSGTFAQVLTFFLLFDAQEVAQPNNHQPQSNAITHNIVLPIPGDDFAHEGNTHD